MCVDSYRHIHNPTAPHHIQITPKADLNVATKSVFNNGAHIVLSFVTTNLNAYFSEPTFRFLVSKPQRSQTISENGKFC